MRKFGNMKAANFNTKLVNGYLALLKNLSPAIKLDLISKLTQSVKTDITVKHNAFEQAFGAWEGNESAEDLINTIKNSRQVNRQIEEM